MTLESLLASRNVIFAFLVLATFVVYGNTFQNDWTYDDLPVVVNNPDIRSLDNFSKNSYASRPLRELSYMLDYKMFGDNPAGYHVQQNLWHAANGCLLFLVMSSLGISPGYALLGTMLFLLHPVQSESVASIGHRKELLPLFFGLSLLLAYMKSLAVSGGMRWVLWLGCLLSYGLALLGNITVVTIPLILPVYEVLFVEKERRVLARYPLICVVAVLLLAGGGGIYYAQKFDLQQALMRTYVQNGFAGTKDYLPLLWVALKVPVLYLGKLLWPVKLSPEYVVTFSTDLLQWGSLAGVMLLSVALVLFFGSRKRLPALSFAIAWCLVLYVPVANLLPVYAYPMADRYLYMVLPGLGIAVAALLQKSAARPLVCLCLVAVLGLSCLTMVQNTYWRNEHALWSHAVEVNPNSKGALWSLGKTYAQNGDFRKAENAFKKVLEIDRFFVYAYLELAKIQERGGDPLAAKENYELFVRYGQYTAPAEAEKVKAYLQHKFR